MPDGGKRVKNELGVVYGNAMQAGSISVHVHGGEARRLPIPRQVPSLEGPFVNRHEEVEELDGLLTWDEVGVTPMAVINGMRGVGKTAIGRYWAHANGEHFEGGCLHADFDDLRRDGAVDVHAVLGGFLRALGLHEDVIPDSIEARSALFISKAAEKRILVLLDNVDYAAQVKSLEPGPSGGVVLITSRAPLEELVGDGAAWIELEPLEEEDSALVLMRASGMPALLEADSDAVAALVEICAGLPIALRVCGALLARERHRPVAWLADHLADESERLRHMEVDPQRSINLVFTQAYRSLTDAARGLYRKLGSHPGTSFSPGLAAAVADVPAEEGSRMLGELRRSNLIEGRDERFRFHELLRIHARAIAAEEESAEEREAAVRRVVDFYVAATRRMDFAIIAERLRLSDPLPEADPELLPSFGSTAEAIGWFDQERANVLAVMRDAAAREWDESAWRLGEALWLPYHNRKHFGEAIEVYTIAAGAAQRQGHDAAESRMRSQLARGYLDLDDKPGAKRRRRQRSSWPNAPTMPNFARRLASSPASSRRRKNATARRSRPSKRPRRSARRPAASGAWRCTPTTSAGSSTSTDSTSGRSRYCRRRKD